MRFRLLSVSILLSAFIPLSSFILQRSAIAQDGISGINRAIVIDFLDKTGVFKGDAVADKLRVEIKKQAPITIYSKNQTLSKYKALNLNRKKMLIPAYRKQAAKFLKVDGYVKGFITKEKYYKLTLKLERVKDMAIVREASIFFKKEIGPNAVRISTAKFLGLTYSVPQPKQAQVPSPAAPLAVAPPVESEQPVKKAPVAVEPKKEKYVESYQEDDEAEKRGLFSVKLSAGLFKNSYSATNPAGSPTTELINIDSGFFPDISFYGEFWAMKFLGIDFAYNMGFMKLNVTPTSGTPFSVSSKFNQISTGVKGRFFLSSMDDSPYVFVRAGYMFQTLKHGTQSTVVLSNNRYNDIPIGAGGKVPFWFIKKFDMGLDFGFDYFVISKLQETVINNGTTNSSKGYQFSFGPYMKVYKSFFADFTYVYNHHAATFDNPDTAQGTRTDAVAGAKSADNFHGLLFSIGYGM